MVGKILYISEYSNKATSLVEFHPWQAKMCLKGNIYFLAFRILLVLRSEDSPISVLYIQILYCKQAFDGPYFWGD